MSALAPGFESLAPEYQTLIRLAQERFNISVMPLQALSGGWSGASIYLVSVRQQNAEEVEHFVLKMDRKNERARTDEIQRHQAVLDLSPPTFKTRHMPRMVFERLEHDGLIAIFYEIAGQSLHQYRPLSAYERQNQLETLFEKTYQTILDEWNAERSFRQAVHPQSLLKDWLGFRLQAGSNIETFLQNQLRIPPDLPGLLIRGRVFPNPLAYARHAEWWGSARPLDALTGLQHGDLNTNNILARFGPPEQTLDGYYLIDFALFKEQMPLLYDLRYLEISYLILKLGQVAFPHLVEMIAGEAEREENRQAPVESAGVSGVLQAARKTFADWVSDSYPSLHDDLWAQYWLAGTAAGLSYIHKAVIPFEERLAGLVYASANLWRYMTLFGLPAPREGREIFDDAGWSNELAAHPATPSPSSRKAAPRIPNNLPAETTSFIGREKQVDAVRLLLAEDAVRLVSLTGPGGVGKSRMALQVARTVLDQFPDGVFFAALAEVTDPELVVSKIARLLGVREGGSQPLLEALKDYLHGLEMLLVLDNLEQVVSVAPVLVELLRDAPGLKILATSRVLLQVRGEHDYPVPPMRTPTPGEAHDLEDLRQQEAVQLFLARAKAADPGFVLTSENAAAVAEICRGLDGLPLALELAAARVRLLPPEMMKTRLANRLSLLTGGARDLPERQQTLRSTLDWSYGLLSQNEQELFACLSVFSGGFTLAAAETIHLRRREVDVLGGVEKLLNNSLLYQEGGAAGQTRFRMLETVREYALGLLAMSGEREDLQRRHALYYIRNVGEEVRFNLYSPESTAYLDWLESEHDNIRAALSWSLEVGDFAEVAEDVSEMVAFLTWFWYRRGYLSEGRAWVERMLDGPALAGRTSGRALALQSSALLAMWQGDLATAEEQIAKSLDIIRELEDEQNLMIIMMNAGVVNLNMGRDTEAHPILKEAQALTEQSKNIFYYGTTLVHLGNVAMGLGRIAEARGWLDKAMATARQLGEPWLMTFALNNLGEVARVEGDWAAARGYYEESESRLRKMGDKGDLARLVHNLGAVAFHEGDDAQAEKLLRSSLAMFRQLSNRRGMAECLAGLADLLHRRGQSDRAAHLLGAAEELLTARGAAWWPADRGEIQCLRTALEEDLGPEAFQTAWQQGQLLTIEQALGLARDDRP